MRISVFGLGYVGAVSSACLASDGHTVIGVDPNLVKTDLINSGRSPVIEERVGELVADAVATGALRAGNSAAEAVAASDLAIICVGTPSQPSGALDLTYVERVCEEIGTALRDKDTYFTVVLRSTVLPGTTRGTVIPILEAASGKKAGVDFGVSMHPEFLREGSAVYDFYAPPKVVIGHAGDDRAADAVAEIGTRGDAPVIRCELEVAELAKYVDNSWHALKVAFANEVGRVAKASGLSGHDVMDVFIQDTKLNISDKYLRPGFAFGGSCLPKDVRAMNAHARSHNLDLPLFGSILPSNERHVAAALELIFAAPGRKVGVLGLSFKAGTDDMRESPVVEVVERLIGKGYDVRVYDENINLARLMGANDSYIKEHIPHIEALMVESAEAAIKHGEIIVIGNGAAGFAEVPSQISEGQTVIDLVGVAAESRTTPGYSGLGW